MEQVPTLAMLSNQERNEDSKLIEALNYNTKLKSLPESDTILLLENKFHHNLNGLDTVTIFQRRMVPNRSIPYPYRTQAQKSS